MSSTLPGLASVLIAAFLGAVVVVAAPACGDDHAGEGHGGSGHADDGHEGDGGEAGDDVIADVNFEGGATDEALIELLAGTPTANAAETASFTAPAAEAALPAASPATFTWALPQQGSRLDILRPGSHELFAPEPSTPGALERTATSTLGLLLSGVAKAHAHGDPVNGRAYFVVFATSADAKRLRVFTTATTYTPDDAAWTKLKGAGAPITATLTSAVFESNRVGADGGPYAGGSLTFTIAE